MSLNLERDIRQPSGARNTAGPSHPAAGRDSFSAHDGADVSDRAGMFEALRTAARERLARVLTADIPSHVRVHLENMACAVHLLRTLNDTNGYAAVVHDGGIKPFDVRQLNQRYVICRDTIKRALTSALEGKSKPWIDSVVRGIFPSPAESLPIPCLRPNWTERYAIPLRWPKPELAAAIQVMCMRDATLCEADLSHFPFWGVDFSRAELSGLLAHHAIFKSCLFVGAHLGHADFQYAGMESCDFSDIRAHHIDLRYGVSVRNNFHRADMLSALVSDTTITDSRFFGADLRGGDLHRSDLRRNVFDHAKLDQTNMEAVDLRGGSLRGTSLRGARVVYADLTDVPVDYTMLAAADFEGSTLPDLGPDIMNYGKDAAGHFILRPGLLPSALDEQVRTRLSARWQAAKAEQARAGEPDRATGARQAPVPGEPGADMPIRHDSSDSDSDDNLDDAILQRQVEPENEPTGFQKWNAFFCSTLVFSSGMHRPAAPPRPLHPDMPVPPGTALERAEQAGD